MNLNDRLADHQSHAHAALLGGDEGLKQLLAYRLSQARTGIANRDGHILVVKPAGDYRNFLLFRLLHRFGGVADQIDQNLLYLDFVDKHRREQSVELQPDLHIQMRHADKSQGDTLLDNLIEVFWRAIAFTFLDEIA